VQKRLGKAMVLSVVNSIVIHVVIKQRGATQIH